VIGPRLKDLGRWFSGGTPPSERAEYWDGDVPWLSGKDFNRTVLREPTKFTTARGAALYSRLVPAGQTVLVLVRGMALAHGLPVARLPFDAAINQDVRGLVVRPEFDPGFVHYALVGRRAELNAHIDRAAHGTARLRDTVYGQRLKWVPDIERQRVIADFLDREGARVASSDLMIEQLADAAVEGYLSVARELIVAPGFSCVLVKLVARPGTGHTPSRNKPEYWREGTCRLPWFGLADVWQIRDDVSDLVQETAERISEAGLANSAAVRHPAGTVLLSRTASVGFVGQMAVDMAVTQDFMTWTCSPLILPEYLLHALRASRPEIMQMVQGSTHKTIYMPDLMNLKVPLPPMDVQRRVVDELQPRIEARRRVRPQGESLRAALTAYRDSLIHEAVTGKLDVTKVSDRQMDERLHAAAEGRLDEVPV
jgi:type I restriction enzyme S subunit